MKRPIYAALDLHSRMSVLGSMDHEGQTQPRMRFATEATILRAQVERLQRRRRPLYLTMEDNKESCLAAAGRDVDDWRGG